MPLLDMQQHTDAVAEIRATLNWPGNDHDLVIDTGLHYPVNIEEKE